VALTQGTYVLHSLVTALDRRPDDLRLTKLIVTPPDKGLTESDIKFLREAVQGLEVVRVKGHDAKFQDAEE
jgi:hypothetical protein